MRSPGVSLEPLDGRIEMHPGSIAAVRLLVTGTNGADVPVSLHVSDHPEGWDARVAPDSVQIGPDDRQAIATIGVGVPKNVSRGRGEVTVDAEYPGGRSSITFPIDVVPRKRRVWLLAGVAAGAVAGAAYGAWEWMRRR